MKLRAPTRQTNKLLAALGASPVSMPVTGLADAMSKGVLDGAVVPWEVVPAVKVHEVARFHTETDPNVPALYTAVFLFAMNAKTYASGCRRTCKAVIDRNSGLACLGAGGSPVGASRRRRRASSRWIVATRSSWCPPRNWRNWQRVAQPVRSTGSPT